MHDPIARAPRVRVLARWRLAIFFPTSTNAGILAMRPRTSLAHA